jgi:hypothetical protein
LLALRRVFADFVWIVAPDWPGLLDLNVNQVLDAEEGVIYYANRTGRWTEVGDMLSFMPYLNFSSSQEVADAVFASMDPTTAAGYLPDDTHPDVVAGYKAQVDSIRTMHTDRTTAGSELIVGQPVLPCFLTRSIRAVRFSPRQC